MNTGKASERKPLLTPANPRCEYLVNPLGIDARQPRLSWIVESEENGQSQSAYRITAASSEEKLTSGDWDLWDTGVVKSPETLNIPYAGRNLESRNRCWWRVQVWDRNSNPSGRSDAAWFEMGLLEPGDWKAHWISGAHFSASPLLRRDFALRGPVESARLYICGQGVYEARINGSPVGGRPLAPTLSYFSRRMFYDTFDVSGLLRQGENAIGVWLAPGWFGDPATWSEMKIDAVRHRYPYPANALIAQLEVRYGDGSVETVCTDEYWKTDDSPLTPVKSFWKYCFGWSGEIYDASKEQPGWDSSGFDDAGWSRILYVDAPTAELSAGMIEPNCIRRSLAPVSSEPVRKGTDADGLLEILNRYGLYNGGTTFGDGVWFFEYWQKSYREAMERCGGRFLGGFVYDFGRHVSGGIEIEARGRKGDWLSIFGVDCHRFRGEGEETVKLRFIHRAFRYAPVFFFGDKTVPEILYVRAYDISNDIESAGDFSCSDGRLNELSAVVKRTFEGHLLSGMLMDSWQERFGTFMPGEAALYNWNMAALCGKLASDFRDQQTADGRFSMLGAPISLDYPAMKSIIADVPWLLYVYCGDKEILRQNYEMIRKYTELVIPRHDLRERTWRPLQTGRAEGGYGDHGRPGTRWYEPKEGDLFETIGMAGYFGSLAAMARALGEEADAGKYQSVAHRLEEKCNREDFLDRENGLYADGDQGCHAAAIAAGIVPPELEQRVAGVLVSDIMEKRDGHLNTGFGGTVCLLKALMKLNRPDVAVRILVNETPPSPWSMLNHPQSPERLTIMPEFWTGGMIPHPGLSTIGFWFYQSAGGIMPDPLVPGFKHVIIRPQVAPSLEWVNAEYLSARGRIKNSWRKDGGLFSMQVVIPANTTATVFVPGKDARVKGDEKLVEMRGGEVEGYTAFAVPGGTYHFESAAAGL